MLKHLQLYSKAYKVLPEASTSSDETSCWQADRCKALPRSIKARRIRLPLLRHRLAITRNLNKLWMRVPHQKKDNITVINPVSDGQEKTGESRLVDPEAPLDDYDEVKQALESRNLEYSQEAQAPFENAGSSARHMSVRYPAFRARNCRFSPTQRPQSREDTSLPERYGTTSRGRCYPPSYRSQAWKLAPTGTADINPNVSLRRVRSSFQAGHQYRQDRSRSPSLGRRLSIPDRMNSPSENFGQRGPIHLPKDWPPSKSERPSSLLGSQKASYVSPIGYVSRDSASSATRLPSYPFGRLPQRPMQQSVKLADNGFENHQLKHRQSWHPSSRQADDISLGHPKSSAQSK